jgi:predicted kinase
MAFLIVSGPSGSGKSGLAKDVGWLLAWPVLSNDDINERLADTLGLGNESWSRHLSDASFNVLFEVASNCPDAVLEANFNPENEGRRISELPGKKAQIFCNAHFDVLIERVHARVHEGERHPIHEDVMSPGDIETDLRGQVRLMKPLPIDGPVLQVDATRDLEISGVAEWVRTVLVRRASVWTNRERREESAEP